jgi:hypothetical protein
MTMFAGLAGGVSGLISQLTAPLANVNSAPAASQALTAAQSYLHRPSRYEQLMTDALHAQNIDDETVAEIQSAINNQIAQLKANGKVTRESVKYAVDGILKQYGVDVQKFEAYMQAHRPNGPAQNAGGQAAPATDSTAGEVDVYA